MQMRHVLTAFVLSIGLSGPAAIAQDRAQTLADIRQELSVLYVEIQKLKTELSTTGSPGLPANSGTLLDRINAIEGELKRLTGRTEELEHRIDEIVRDGTNRIGDLEFRLVELEGGDVSKLGETTTLGGETPSTATPTASPMPVPTPQAGMAGMSGQGQLAVAEEQDYTAAMQAYDAGRYAEAAQAFETFAQTYTGGPLTGQAYFMRGEALAALGETANAARAYLTAFSSDPEGPRAAQSLVKLGTALGTLGQTSEACVTLGEVGRRFPGSPSAADAQAAMQGLGCN